MYCRAVSSSSSQQSATLSTLVDSGRLQRPSMGFLEACGVTGVWKKPGAVLAAPLPRVGRETGDAGSIMYSCSSLRQTEIAMTPQQQESSSAHPREISRQERSAE